MCSEHNKRTELFKNMPETKFAQYFGWEHGPSMGTKAYKHETDKSWPLYWGIDLTLLGRGLIQIKIEYDSSDWPLVSKKLLHILV